MDTNYGSLGDSIQKLTELTEENNRILKAMRRDKWVSLIVSLVFWGVVCYASYALTAQLLGQFGISGTDFSQVLEQYQAQQAQ